MLTLFTDTDNDVTPRLAREYGYRLISMPYSIDGVTVFPYEDGDDFDMKSFYAKLRAGTIPTTSGLSAERKKGTIFSTFIFPPPCRALSTPCARHLPTF